MSKSFWAGLLALVLALPIFAAEPAPKDGFPAGDDTPEGAACDLARAFIRDDASLFLATCVAPYGSPEARLAYHRFLEGIVLQMKMPPVSRNPSPNAPKSIARCYAARHLSSATTHSGRGSPEVMFVDVTARLQSGDTQVCRTLVLKGEDGKWKVDPQPEQTPLLSAGLDDESPSTQEVPVGQRAN